MTNQKRLRNNISDHIAPTSVSSRCKNFVALGLGFPCLPFLSLPTSLSSFALAIPWTLRSVLSLGFRCLFDGLIGCNRNRFWSHCLLLFPWPDVKNLLTLPFCLCFLCPYTCITRGAHGRHCLANDSNLTSSPLRFIAKRSFHVCLKTCIKSSGKDSPLSTSSGKRAQQQRYFVCFQSVKRSRIDSNTSASCPPHSTW